MYPSLEDMKVGQAMQAAQQPAYAATQPGYASFPFAQVAGPTAPMPTTELERAYPALFDMGLSLTPEEVAMITDYQVVAKPAATVAMPTAGPVASGMIAPLSGSSLGLARAQVTHGIRELTLCKDAKGKCGFRVQNVSKGIFVVLVQQSSAAALAGLRFGDQILQINEQDVAGWSIDKVHNMIKKMPANGIKIVVRDRPFERTITLHKDTANTIGFRYKNGRINAVVKDSSAARNGVLTDHNLLEVNGQNVVGLPDDATRAIIDAGGQIITITVMPSVIYDHLIKNVGGSLVKKLMDHSIPDL
jgi:syntenin-1